MKRKYLVTAIIFILISNTIFSIGFGFHTFETRISPEFSKGVFPTSLIYQFDFPIPNMIENRATEIDFRIDNGLDFRTLRQTPENGKPFASDPDNEEWLYPKEYTTIYNEMNIVFGQGFWDSINDEKDLLKLWATVDIRFENSYERLNYLLNPNQVEGLFLKQPKINENTDAIERFPGSDWIGQPELKGNRSTTNLSISLGLDINYMSNEITRRNGMSYSFWTRLNPSWFNFLGEESHDYLLFWNKLDLAFTPLYIRMQGKRDTSWFSIVLDNSTTYRYISGNRIPQYIQGGDIYGAKALNTKHVITNRASITMYGPQINSYDCYPYMTAFIDIGFSCGSLLNSIETTYYTDTITSIGFKAAFNIFNIAEFYYELGYVLDNVLNENKIPITRFGFTFGV